MPNDLWNDELGSSLTKSSFTLLSERERPQRTTARTFASLNAFANEDQVRCDRLHGVGDSR
jgi:hypothetical protein